LAQDRRFSHCTHRRRRRRHRHRHRCRHRALSDVFRIEYNVAISCCAAHDFAEGVRALLIDKDRSPKWDPPTLAAVEQKFIESHFRDHHDGAHPLSDWR